MAENFRFVAQDPRVRIVVREACDDGVFLRIFVCNADGKIDKFNLDFLSVGDDLEIELLPVELRLKVNREPIQPPPPRRKAGDN